MRKNTFNKTLLDSLQKKIESCVSNYLSNDVCAVQNLLNRLYANAIDNDLYVSDSNNPKEDFEIIGAFQVRILQAVSSTESNLLFEAGREINKIEPDMFYSLIMRLMSCAFTSDVFKRYDATSTASKLLGSSIDFLFALNELFGDYFECEHEMNNKQAA